MSYKKLLLAVFCALPFSLFALHTRLPLKEAMLKKMVAVDASSNGGHMGKGLSLEVTNLTSNDLTLTVDPGLIFTPNDTGFQNLVALGGEMIDLPAYNCGRTQLQTFCGKSYASSPLEGLTYQYWKQGDSSMVNTMDYMREKRIKGHLAQMAVWTFTNQHCLSTVFEPDEKERSKELINFIAMQRHIPIPKYYTYYELNNVPGMSVISQNSGKHYVEVSWKTGEGFGNMYVNVYKEDGNLYKTVKGSEVCDARGCLVTVKFDPAVDKRGKYFVVVEDDTNKVWVKKEVLVGADWCNYTAMN